MPAASSSIIVLRDRARKCVCVCVVCQCSTAPLFTDLSRHLIGSLSRHLNGSLTTPAAGKLTPVGMAASSMLQLPFRTSNT